MTRRRRMDAAVEDSKIEVDFPAGTEIVVTWGEETFSPVQYNSFRIGGHSVKVIVQKGETGSEAFRRGWLLLQEAAEIQFVDKLAGFRDRMDRTKRHA